jgi:hypothetical protein
MGAVGYLRKSDDHETLAKEIEEMFKKNQKTESNELSQD